MGFAADNLFGDEWLRNHDRYGCEIIAEKVNRDDEIPF
jgi:hypothetical protein